MNSRRPSLPCHVAILALLGLTTVAEDMYGQLLIDTRGGVELWGVPQASPGGGLRAIKIELRTVDPTAKIVTFENLTIAGYLHQVHLPGTAGTVAPTPHVGTIRHIPTWEPADSHLLITPEMVGGGTGGAFEGISESNNRGNVAGLDDSLQPPGAITGIGSIEMGAPTDTFSLTDPFRSNHVDLAYLVAQRWGLCTVELNAGILGEGIVDSGMPGGAEWGRLSLGILCFPEPSTNTLALLSILLVFVWQRQKL